MSLCGSDCCSVCPRRKECGGCEACQGKPFGGSCTAAECIKACGMDAFLSLKRRLVEEINGLGIDGLHVEDLCLLFGSYVNLAYPLPSGAMVQLLKNDRIYLGTQVEREGNGRCYGVVADSSFVLVAEYGEGGRNPKLIVLRSR